MTTTTEKILERAAHYDRLAAALRLAAHELNGHLTEKKQAGGGVGAMLSAAVQLREEQREQVRSQRIPQGGTKGVSPTKAAQTAARKDTIRALLAEGPRSSGEIQAHLAASGDDLSNARVAQILSKELHCRRTGRGNASRWGLARPGAHKPRPKQSKSVLLARRRRSAAVLAKLDRTEARPLSSKEIGLAGGLIVHGYIHRKGDGYIRTAKEFTV